MVRHAKSSWDRPLSDRERPLAARGLRDVALMSAYIAKNKPKPDLLWTSDANRAHTTALYFKEAYRVEDSLFEIRPNLYDFGGSQVLEEIKSCDNAVNHLMIFGHNHAFTSLTNMLGSEYIENLPTCGFVHLEFNVDSWREINSGSTRFILVPKEIRK